MEVPGKFNKSDDPGILRPSQQNNPKPWEIGFRIENRYEILGITRGGMGIVYIAHDPEWNQKFAVKTFQDRFLWNEKIIQRFMAEAETWVDLERHTNIVFANFVQKIEGKPFLFLEYIDSGDLNRFIGKMSIAEALDFAIQFCTGMEYAYNKLGVIHRDIKPGNVMVQKDPRFRYGYCYKVSDFGLVKAIGGEFEYKLPEVSTGLGTSLFMPPEQFPVEIQKMFAYSGKVTTRSDIYAFGVTLYLLLTGKFPFMDLNRTFMQYPAHPKIFNPEIPEQMDKMIVRCLEKNPDKRYSDFTALKKELENLFFQATGSEYITIGKKEILTTADWNRKGVALYYLGKFQKADECFEKALKLDPKFSGAWLNKGNALSAIGRKCDAIGCYEKTLEINPQDAVAWNNMAAILIQQKKYSDAIRCCDKALTIDPKYLGAWNNKGVVYVDLGKFQEAIYYYYNILKTFPRFAEAWYNLGRIFIKMKEFEKSLQFLEKALEINPKYHEAWGNKGLALSEIGRFPEAIVCFDTGLTLDSESYEIWNNKGRAFYLNGKHPEALKCIERAIEINPAFEESWNNKGVVLHYLNRQEEAILCFDKALALNPRSIKTWFDKGVAFQSLRLFTEAVACYDKALEISPEYADPLMNKGSALSALGKRQEAIACFEKFIALAPPHYASLVEQAKQLIRQVRGF